MTESNRPIGKTTIAPEVLLSIARLTTLSTPGVSRLGTAPANSNRLWKKDVNHGVIIAVENNIVYVDIYVVLEHDVNIREVCRDIQKHISRSISELVGMEVDQINVHVDDIDYGPRPEAV
jgi:uncharacterized alkaline shock family protein YloU